MVQCTGCEPEVKSDIVLGTVMEVNKCPCKVIYPLEKVVTWLECEDGVERRDVTTAGRKVVRVRIAIVNEVWSAAWDGELLLENAAMCGEPCVPEEGEDMAELRTGDYVPFLDCARIGHGTIEGEGNVRDNADEEVCLGLEDCRGVG